MFIAYSADDLMIVFTGGVGVKAAYMPTGGTSKAVSRLICGCRSVLWADLAIADKLREGATKQIRSETGRD